MDKKRFDNLAKAMASGTSRRTLMRGMLGGVAAGAAFAVLPRGAGVSAQTVGGVAGDECDIEVEDSCQSPYTCFEAICDIPRGCVGDGLPCVDDFPCCEDEGLSCVDGICVVPVDSSAEVEALPDTGAGAPGSSNGWLGVIAAGGALAAAATVLRTNKSESEDQGAS